MKKITVKQAIQQGYDRCMIKGYEWGSAYEISELSEVDFEEDEWTLLSKETYYPSGMPEREIANLIADKLNDEEKGESGRETDDVYESIMGLDFSDIENKINEKLKELPYWKDTNIELIWEDPGDK